VDFGVFVVDGVKDVVKIGCDELVGGLGGVEGALGVDGAVGVDEVYALGELVDFGLSGGSGVGVDLAIGVG